jgi:acyl-homoserine-lactone acylase
MSFGRCIVACVVLVVVAGVAGTGGGLGATDDAAPGGITELGHEGHYRAVIRRTEYGIPHILAADLGNVGFGYGYAFAQDNLCTLEQSVLTVSGARSEFFGPGADFGDQLSRGVSNLDSDVYYRSINASGVIEQAMSRPAPRGPTPQARQPDPTCRAQPWARPITETDLDRLLYSVNQYGGTAAFISSIAQAHPVTNTSATPADVAPQGFGSNGIAIGRNATGNGHGELLANPHFPWRGGNRFYQVQLTIPGQLDVSGASLYGSPVVEIGHTTHPAGLDTHRLHGAALHPVPTPPDTW